MRENEHLKERECCQDHPNPRGVISMCGKGGYVDLSNMPAAGMVLVRANIDTTKLTNPVVRIDFNCILGFNVTTLEELNLVFTLLRSDENGDVTELASWPYKVLMDQTLTGGEEEEYVFIILEKNESFCIGYCDMPKCAGCHTYSIRVDVNYFNITAALIQSSFIGVQAQSA